MKLSINDEKEKKKNSFVRSWGLARMGRSLESSPWRHPKGKPTGYVSWASTLCTGSHTQKAPGLA